MIAVVDYQMGNLKNVERGLYAAGADARITASPSEIAAAKAIVLPGVGSFADAAASMQSLGQSELLRERILAGVPFLGICLGLHLLFEAGEEHARSPQEPSAGLGILPGVVRALPARDAQGQQYKIPHVGWNEVHQMKEPGTNALFKGIKQDEYFYFTHSYAVPKSQASIATTTHSIEFPCAVQYGEACFAVQFHPEKSSDAGMQLLRNFVTLAREI